MRKKVVPTDALHQISADTFRFLLDFDAIGDASSSDKFQDVISHFRAPDFCGLEDIVSLEPFLQNLNDTAEIINCGISFQ